MSRELYKDDRYFEDFIIYQNKRIEKFEDTLTKLGEGDSSKVKQCQRILANFYKDLLSAKYSVGAVKQEVQRIYFQYLKAFKQCSISDYAEMVDILSLAILFDTAADDIRFALENTEYASDALVSVLKSKLSGEKPALENGQLLFPEQYEIFYQYITGSINTESFIAFMEDKWYALCSEFAWFDSHKSTENIYVGYWSWLAGAALKINAAVVSEKQYIPCGLL